MDAATIYRDHKCRITGSEEATDVAHVIPVSQMEWFSRNDMARYGCDPLMQRSVNDLSNTILLRADLHQTFDALKWATIPKPNSQNVLQFVFHSIQYSPELATRYHNSCVRDITGVSPQLLLPLLPGLYFPQYVNFYEKTSADGFWRYLLDHSSMSQDIILGMNVIWPLGAMGRGRSISLKKRKGTNQQDAKEACGLEGASSVDSIEYMFNNREEFECPHNPSSSKGNISIDTFGDQDHCTCTLSSGSDGPYPANKALPSFPAYCRSANCRYRLREEYWRKLRLGGLEKERQIRDSGVVEKPGIVG